MSQPNSKKHRRKRVKTNWQGGVLAIPRQLKRSEAFLDLSCPARCLMLELQDVWRPGASGIHYSVRRASEALKVSNSTAARCFAELEQHGFIKLSEEADWLSGKAREWVLTWVDSGGKLATCEWMDWAKN